MAEATQGGEPNRALITVCAMAATLLGVSVSRSTIAGSSALDFAASTSLRLASSNRATLRSAASAMTVSARFFAAVSAFAMARDASRAARPTECM